MRYGYSMAEITIYHNSNCSKSRATLQLILDSGRTPRIVEYLADPPTAAELDRLLKMLDLAPDAIVRRGEDRFRELDLERNPPKSREAWLALLVANPILIERPVVTDGTRAVIGRPPESVRELL